MEIPSMDAFVRPRVTFDAFSLDVSSGELYRRGHRLRLQEQPFQVLVMLIERPGTLVTREELRHRLWPGETVVGFDDGLNSAVSRLRFVLGDSADHPRFIETVPRRGYRFIAPIEVPPEALDLSPKPVSQPDSDPVRSLRSALVLAAAISLPLAVIVLGAIAFRLSATAEVQTPAQEPLPELSFTQITSASGPEGQPALSHDGAFIAWVSGESGHGDIYFRAIDGGEAINLTADSPANDWQPAFAPGAQMIAFRSEREGGGIFVMDFAGKSVRRLTDFGHDPSWSPDRREIVVATEGVITPMNRTSTSTLWRIDLDTGEKREISKQDAVQPAWSPSGHRIAFWQVSSGGWKDVATVPAEGGEIVRITNDAALDWSPVWSADGRWLFFSSDRGGSMNLWRVRIDELTGQALSEPQAVTTPSRWSGDLSLGGNRIAYSAVDPRANVEKLQFDPDREAVIGSPLPVTSGTSAMIQPDVSPDGEWVVFRSESEQEDLYVSRLDGSEMRQLTFDSAKDRAPRWSADGKRIVFYSDRGGKYNVWTIDRDGRGLEQLTALSGNWPSFPRWSPDGNRLIVNNSQGSYFVDLSGSEKPATRLEPLAPFPEEDRIFRAFCWSPDGKWLAGVRYALNGTHVPGAVIYEIETGTYTLIHDSGNSAEWLGDSRRLLINDKKKVYLADRESGTVAELTSLSGELRPGLSVNADDTAIFIARARAESDVWVVTLR